MLVDVCDGRCVMCWKFYPGGKKLQKLDGKRKEVALCSVARKENLDRSCDPHDPFSPTSVYVSIENFLSFPLPPLRIIRTRPVGKSALVPVPSCLYTFLHSRR